MGVDIIPADPVSAERRLARAQGLKWETPDTQAIVGGSSAVNGGTQYYTMVDLIAGETTTGLLVRVTTAGGASLTLVKLALVALGGGLLASTADVKAAFNGTTGMIGGDLGTPYTPSASGPVWACFLATGSTLPQIARGNNGFAAAAYGSGVVVGGQRGGLTDISGLAPASGANPHMYVAGY